MIIRYNFPLCFRYFCSQNNAPVIFGTITCFRYQGLFTKSFDMKHKLLLTLCTLLSVPCWGQQILTDQAYYNVVAGTETVKMGSLVNSPSSYSGAFTVPSTVSERGKTYQVVGIGDGVFTDCIHLTSILISEGVVSIGKQAFNRCDALASITLPSTLTNLAEDLFLDPRNLSAIYVDANNPSYTSQEGVLFNKEKSLLITYPKGKTGSSYTIPEGVVSLGKQAFYYCAGLTSVTLPATLTGMGTSAFEGCLNLQAIHTAAGNGSYTSEAGVLFTKDKNTLIAYPCAKTGSSYTIPEGVTSIGAEAFRRCSTLTSVTIPSSVTSIGEYAFSSTRLSDITLPEGVASLGKDAFSYNSVLATVKIPGSMTSIGSRAFYNCSALTAVIIDEVTPIFGADAFLGISSAATLYIPVEFDCSSWPSPLKETAIVKAFSVNRISYRVLSGSTVEMLYGTLNGAVTLPPSVEHSGKMFQVTHIAKAAFEYEPDLTSITIPESVISITEGAFYQCLALQQINVHSNNQFYSSEEGILFSKDKSRLIRYPAAKAGTSYAVPGSVKSIADYAFLGCAAFTSITIPASVKSIGNVVFLLCLNLQKVDVNAGSQSFTSEGGVLFTKDKSTLIVYPSKKTDVSYMIPAGVTSIGSDAFSYCSYLVNVTIPSSVTNIGTHAFRDSPGLARIVTNAVAPAFGDTPFFVLPAATLYVPEGADYDLWRRVFSGTIITKTFINGGIMYCILSPTTVEVLPNSYSGVVSIPSSVSYMGETFQVVAIRGNAFAGCSGLTSITIPSSMTSIGDSAFSGCSGLTFVIIDEVTPIFGTGVFSGIPAGARLCPPEGFDYTPWMNVFDWTVTERVFTYGGIKYNMLSPTTVEVIHSSYSGTVNILSSVEYAGRTSQVIGIGNGAFSGCPGLTSVTIPATVTNVGKSVFYNSPNLQAINVDRNNYSYSSIDGVLFKGVSATTSIIAYPPAKSGNSYTIPLLNKSSIAEHAFAGCIGLTSITIPSVITNIGDSAFWGCSNLSAVIIPAINPVFGVDVFLGLPEGATLYAPAGFDNKDWLKVFAWTINDGVFTSDGIKYNVLSPTEVEVVANSYSGAVNIPSTVKGYMVVSIRGLAFSDCSSLTSVTIPEGVTSIGDFAFWGCSSLTSVTIPVGVTSIGSDTFYRCSSLTSVTIPVGVTSIESNAFYGCSSLTSVIIPEGVTRIGSNAFWGCSSLTSATIPVGVTHIGDGAFQYCSSLTSVTIPEGVTYIGISAFHLCSSLTSVIIPEGVTYIGISAFSRCYSLTSMIIKSSTLTATYINRAIDDINSNCLVYLPASLAGVTHVNTVYGGVAPKIVLNEGQNFQCPIAFTATEISYTRKPGTWADGTIGWETIILPFEVASTGYRASLSGSIRPVTSTKNGHFWLRTLAGSTDGMVHFQSTANGKMEANTPYIIAFPGDAFGVNNSMQGESVTYRAENVTVPITPDDLSVGSTHYTYTGLYSIGKASGWMLNAEGSNFLKQDNYGMKPFRAYLTGGAITSASPAMQVLISGSAPTSLEPIGADAGSGDELQILSTPEGVTIFVETPIDVTLRNAAGISVSHLKLQAGSNILSDLPAGVYFIGRQKFIVE